jgi:alpha-beta hydrolase superfamily lysophospholipase
MTDVAAATGNAGAGRFISTVGRERLALRDWPLPDGRKPRAQVLIVHGLGEHAGRYQHVAARLNTWGFAVRAYDQYGHGQSDGPRGGLPTPLRLLEDLAMLVDATRADIGPEAKLVLLGHSLGGLVAGALLARRLREVDALVMSSPALDPGLGPVQKLLIALLPRLLPDLRVSNGLDAQYLSHDPGVGQAYLADTLVHDRIAARLARFIADEGPATVAQGGQWRTPTLLLYAGQDRLVNPAGSRRFAAQAPTALVQAQCFEALRHEIFNELDAAPVFAALRSWLDPRFGCDAT